MTTFRCDKRKQFPFSIVGEADVRYLNALANLERQPLDRGIIGEGIRPGAVHREMKITRTCALVHLC